MKICSKCRCKKEESDFYKNDKLKSKLYSYCKKCHKWLVANRKRYEKKSKDHTKKDILNLRWQSIKSRYKYKGYENVKVLMTKNDFIHYMNNDDLDTLFTRWDIEGRPFRLTPSVDRIDPDGHYQLSNIRWLTVAENGGRGRKKGVHRKKKIAQYTKGGEFVNEYDSITLAASFVKGSIANLCLNARGKIPSAYGYIWKYVDNLK